MIAVIESKAELERFAEILKEEASKMLLLLGVLDLKQPGVHETLIDRTKVRYRAWQMEQPGFEASGAAAEYRREAVLRSLEIQCQSTRT